MEFELFIKILYFSYFKKYYILQYFIIDDFIFYNLFSQINRPPWFDFIFFSDDELEELFCYNEEENLDEINIINY